MTKAVYQSMFVSLSALLLAALFVLQPSNTPELKEFQSTIRERFTVASSQLLQGESFTEPVALVWTTVNNFYSQSADQAIAMLRDDNLANIALMFNGDYLVNQAVAFAPQVTHAPTEDALMNIIPMSDADKLLNPYFGDELAYHQPQGIVAGESVDYDKPAAPPTAAEPAKPPLVWMTVNDSITQYPYCVAVFNGTVNSYPGACARDDLNPIYEN